MITCVYVSACLCVHLSAKIKINHERVNRCRPNLAAWAKGCIVSCKKYVSVVKQIIIFKFLECNKIRIEGLWMNSKQYCQILPEKLFKRSRYWRSLYLDDNRSHFPTFHYMSGSYVVKKSRFSVNIQIWRFRKSRLTQIYLKFRGKRKATVQKIKAKFPNQPWSLSCLNKLIRIRRTECWKVWFVIVKIWRSVTRLFKRFLAKFGSAIQNRPGSCYPTLLLIRLHTVTAQRLGGVLYVEHGVQVSCTTMLSLSSVHHRNSSSSKWLNVGVNPISDVDPGSFSTFLNITRYGILLPVV